MEKNRFIEGKVLNNLGQRKGLSREKDEKKFLYKGLWITMVFFPQQCWKLENNETMPSKLKEKIISNLVFDIQWNYELNVITT